MPALNILSFLGAENTESAAKKLGGRGWRTLAGAVKSFVDVDPMEINFKSNNKNITIESNQIKILSHVARLAKGIPNPKERPVISLPWSLEFNLTLWDNPDLNEDTLRKLFDDGGISIGLGTYRGVYGKFKVKKWE